ncbi:MAG: hypothetical protein SFU27_07405 [Thermonemataceae bacterium]|nr:hypothetical protein [Thermonemataceae bacterium]
MKKQIFKPLTMLFLSGVLFLGACKKDDPQPVNEQEVITKVTVTFTNTADAADVVNFIYDDEDGTGGNSPIITNGTLRKNSTYAIEVQVTGEDNEDITAEISEEANEHQIYFGFSQATMFPTFSYEDADDNNKPIGLSSKVTTLNGTGGGNLQMILVHEPNKSANSTSSPWIYNSNVGGEQDFNVTFNVKIE